MVKFLTWFAKFYKPVRFFGLIRRIGVKFLFARKALTLFYCLQDRETPLVVKAVVMGALGYFILPIDAVPDVLAGLGWIDDAAVIAFAMRFADSYIKAEHIERARKYLPFGH